MTNQGRAGKPDTPRIKDDQVPRFQPTRPIDERPPAANRPLVNAGRIARPTIDVYHWLDGRGYAGAEYNKFQVQGARAVRLPPLWNRQDATAGMVIRRHHEPAFGKFDFGSDGARIARPSLRQLGRPVRWAADHRQMILRSDVRTPSQTVAQINPEPQSGDHRDAAKEQGQPTSPLSPKTALTGCFAANDIIALRCRLRFAAVVASPEAHEATTLLADVHYLDASIGRILTIGRIERLRLAASDRLQSRRRDAIDLEQLAPNGFGARFR